MFPNGTPQITISLAITIKSVSNRNFNFSQLCVLLRRGVSFWRGTADAENPERDSHSRCRNSRRRSPTGAKISSISVQ